MTSVNTIRPMSINTVSTDTPILTSTGRKMPDILSLSKSMTILPASCWSATTAACWTAASARSISEFFVMRKYRRKGIGKLVAWQVFDLFPGQWEVGQYDKNDPAKIFWQEVIGAYTNGNYRKEQVVTDGWAGQVLVFEIRDRSMIEIQTSTRSCISEIERFWPSRPEIERLQAGLQSLNLSTSRFVILSVPRRIPGALTGMNVLLSFRACLRQHFRSAYTPARNLGLRYRDPSLVTQDRGVLGYARSG